MTNRPENKFTYWFGSLLVLQVAVLIYLSFFSLDLQTSRWSISYGASDELIFFSMEESAPLEFGETPSYSPPLAYWLSTAGHQLISDHQLGYRIFHILLYLTWLAVFFLLVRKYLDARTAFYSCCILVASLLFSWHMQLATGESLGAIFMISALFGFFLYLKSAQKKFFWLIYISLGLGILSVGIKGLVLPVVILFIFLMFRIKMNGQTLQKLQFGRGILFSVLLCLPWFIFAGWISDGKWLYEFFITNPWKDYGSEFFGWQGAFYLPFLYIMLGILPFGFFLPGAFGYSWKFRHKKPLLLLSAVGLLVILLIYAFSDSFLPHFLLPAFPFAAILTAYQLGQLSGRSLSKMKLYLGICGTAFLALAIPIGLHTMLHEAIGNGQEPVFLFYLLLLILPVGAISCFTLWQMKKTDEGVVALTLSFMVFNLLIVQFAQSIKPLQSLLLMFII